MHVFIKTAGIAVAASSLFSALVSADNIGKNYNEAAERTYEYTSSGTVIIEEGYPVTVPFGFQSKDHLLDSISPQRRGDSDKEAPSYGTVISTTGGGKHWTAWPSSDKFGAYHSNPKYKHRSTACNIRRCVRSHGTDGMRSPSSSGSAEAIAYASNTGNKGYWAIER